MAVTGQVVGGGYSDHAGAENDYFHRSILFAACLAADGDLDAGSLRVRMPQRPRLRRRSSQRTAAESGAAMAKYMAPETR